MSKPHLKCTVLTGCQIFLWKAGNRKQGIGCFLGERGKGRAQIMTICATSDGIWGKSLRFNFLTSRTGRRY